MRPAEEKFPVTGSAYLGGAAARVIAWDFKRTGAHPAVIRLREGAPDGAVRQTIEIEPPTMTLANSLSNLAPILFAGGLYVEVVKGNVEGTVTALA